MYVGHRHWVTLRFLQPSQSQSVHNASGRVNRILRSYVNSLPRGEPSCFFCLLMRTCFRGWGLQVQEEVGSESGPSSRLIYVIARFTIERASDFLLWLLEAAFLVNHMPVFIGFVAFNINPLPAY